MTGSPFTVRDGRVYVDGKPLEGVTVALEPEPSPGARRSPRHVAPRAERLSFGDVDKLMRENRSVCG